MTYPDIKELKLSNVRKDITSFYEILALTSTFLVLLSLKYEESTHPLIGTFSKAGVFK